MRSLTGGMQLFRIHSRTCLSDCSASPQDRSAISDHHHTLYPVSQKMQSINFQTGKLSMFYTFLFFSDHKGVDLYFRVIHPQVLIQYK